MSKLNLFIPKPSFFSLYIDLFGIEKRLIGQLELLKLEVFSRENRSSTMLPSSIAAESRSHQAKAVFL
jgi:hypothetical protein